MTFLSSLCVYCGSSVGTNPRHRAAAVGLGTLMAANRVRLIYGGGRIGLMGVLADAVLVGGGTVIGVIPEHLDSRELGHRNVSELRVVDSMHMRKNMMFELSDAFAVLPGGLGTLDETFEMLTWRQLRLHDKPIVLINIDDYWQPFIDLVDHVVASGFAPAQVRRLITVVDTIEEVIATIRRQPEPVIAAAPPQQL